MLTRYAPGNFVSLAAHTTDRETAPAMKPSFTSTVDESASCSQEEDGNYFVNIATLATIFATRLVSMTSAGPVSTIGIRRCLIDGRRSIAARADDAGAAAC
jgi:hypothetical protein